MITIDFDPNVFVYGNLKISWYSILYTSGFLLIYSQIYSACRRQAITLSHREFRAYVLIAAISVLVGARAVHVLIYAPSFYLSHPADIPRYWQGGLAQHGALLGLFLSTVTFVKSRGQRPLMMLDTVLYMYPIAIFAGRLGNFFNGELWGRVADPDFPLAVVFPRAGAIPRHPSQLYEALTEGLLLFLVFKFLRARKTNRAGTITVAFVLGYSTLRFLTEFFREPDGELERLFNSPLSTGQWLCVVMFALGIRLYLALSTHPRPQVSNRLYG